GTAQLGLGLLELPARGAHHPRPRPRPVRAPLIAARPRAGVATAARACDPCDPSRPGRAVSLLLLLFDLLGTFVFALSGGTVAVRHRLDLFGVLVLSCAAAVSGGIARDVLIGAQPPAALADWRYLAVAMLAGVVTFYRHEAIERMRNPVQLCDAAGLAVFAVLGTGRALDFGVPPFAATLLGMLSGIGGGIARDLLVARTPVVLQAELYAVAALAGAGLVALA